MIFVDWGVETADVVGVEGFQAANGACILFVQML